MNLLDEFRSCSRSTARLPYVAWTGVLLAAAYLALRIVMIAVGGHMHLFPDGWQFLDPLGLILSDGRVFRDALIVHLLLTIGLVVISVHRARDAGWQPWTGVLMILPVVRLFVFTALAVAPTAKHTHVLNLPRDTRLGRIIPTSRTGSAVAAILISLVIVIPLGFFDVRVLEDYGLVLFIGLPFLLGAVSAYLYNYHEARSMKQSIGVAMISVSITLVMVFIFAMEGIMCLAMAAPIVYGIAFVGALIGHALSRNANHNAPAMTMMVLLAPCMMAFENANDHQPPLFNVITSVIVHAPAQRVWHSLITFSHMKDPEEFIFRAGISYPIEARITGTGVGACRYCEFNTGPFVEPITAWDEPHLLAFDVKADPPPMTELTIYEHINAPHVKGFFRSHHGQFRLVALSDGTTLLEGTTWYTHDIWPTWYWKWWSDGILHTIHERVLEHIKEVSEHEG